MANTYSNHSIFYCPSLVCQTITITNSLPLLEQRSLYFLDRNSLHPVFLSPGKFLLLVLAKPLLPLERTFLGASYPDFLHCFLSALMVIPTSEQLLHCVRTALPICPLLTCESQSQNCLCILSLPQPQCSSEEQINID